MIGLTTGSAKFELKGNQFLPGAIGDNLTSYGAVFGTPHDQTRCTEFLAAGCSASYGTVVEPYNYAQKFPTARLHVYYALGFTAAEAYWMSVLWPQEGLFVGDPLTRPFGSGPTITFDTLKADQAVKGVIDFRASANAGESQAGVAHVEAFWMASPTVSRPHAASPPTRRSISPSATALSRTPPSPTRRWLMSFSPCSGSSRKPVT